MKTSPLVYVLCLWERHSAEFPHFGWPETSEGARCGALMASHDRRINIQLNTKYNYLSDQKPKCEAWILVCLNLMHQLDLFT